MPSRIDGRRPRRLLRLPLFSKKQAQDDVRQELQHHLELVREELVKEGWSDADAAAEAERSFGDLDTTLDYCTQQSTRAMTKERRTMWLDEFRQDVKYGLRTLLHSKTYSLVVVITLALGIAANTTIFSMMNPYLFRELPFADAERLVQIGGVDREEGFDAGRLSPPQVADLVSGAQALEAAGFYYYGTTNLAGDGPAEQLNIGHMSGELFETLGTVPLHGRYLTQSDVVQRNNSVVIGEKLWRSRYGSDPGVLGQAIELDEELHTVVGVMPEAFGFPFRNLYIWKAIQNPDRLQNREFMGVLPVARLQTGWSNEQALQELATIQAELAQRFPDLDGRYETLSAKPLREALNFAWAPMRIGFYLLLGAVAFVLIMACLNVASLTLARSGSRIQEVAIRSAVGAHKARLVRQLVTESLLLSVAGGALGVALAFAAARSLNGLIPDELFRVGEVKVDGTVLIFSAIITLFTPLAFGLAPAIGLARKSLATSIRESSVAAQRNSGRGRQALVVAEVTLAIVLVMGTGLMIRSLQEVTKVDLGFDHSHLVTAQVTPKAERYDDTDALNGYFQTAKERLARLPGVRAVATASHLPLNHERFSIRAQTGSGIAEPMDQWPSALTSRVDGDFFQTMGIPVLAGNTFVSAGGSDEPPVVISKDLADRLFPNGAAVGQLLSWGLRDQVQTAEIVGVVGEIRYSDLTSQERPHVYRPLEASSVQRRFLIADVDGRAGSLTQDMRRTLTAIDPDVPATTKTYSSLIRESTLLWTMSSFFLGIFGVIAVLLAGLGIYGLMTYSVAQRRREMGLRIALGAGTGSIQRSVILSAMKLASLGLAAGVLISLLGANAAGSVLYGISALDPLTLFGVLLLFGLIALVAAAIPARRAATVDPLQVLRSD